MSLSNRVSTTQTASQTTSAMSELESLLTTTWSEALGREDLTPEDNFFDLGGTSLVVAALRKRLATEGVQLAMPDVYRYPSVRALAGYLAA